MRGIRRFWKRNKLFIQSVLLVLIGSVGLIVPMYMERIFAKEAKTVEAKKRPPHMPYAED